MSRVFVGRDDEMTKLEQLFCPPRPSHKMVYAVYGLGGIGKSQLVAQFANRQRDTFTAIFWINGTTKESFIRDMAGIAPRVSPKAPKGDLNSPPFQEKMCELVSTWLENDKNYKWLIIVDNVDLDSGGVQSTSRHYELDTLLPGAAHGSVLITTRDASLKQRFESLELLPFISEDSAIELLAEISGREPQGKQRFRSLIGYQSVFLLTIAL